MNNKKAIIRLEHSILQTSVQLKDQNKTIVFLNQLKQYLIKQKIISDKTYNLTVSIDENIGNLICKFNIIKLKQLQDILMTNKFNVTFII